MIATLVLGSLMLVAGLGFMFFAIGIWIGNMQINHYVKQQRGNDIEHVVIFFVVGLLLDLFGNMLANSPIRLFTLPWYVIAASITLYFGFRTGKIH